MLEDQGRMRRVISETSTRMNSCSFFVTFRERGDPSPMPYFEENLVKTRATTDEVEMKHAPFWALQQTSLTEDEQNFLLILDFVIPSLICIFMYLLCNCYNQWVSYREDERKQKKRYQKKMDLLKKMKVDYKRHAKFQNERFSPNGILASKATGKKMAFPINKVQVGLAPPPNLKTVTAKVVSWRNQTHRAAGSLVQIHNGKLDSSKVPTKMKVINISQQVDGDNLQMSESSLRMHEGGEAWLIDSEESMEFTEENIGDSPYMESPDKMWRRRENGILAWKETGKKMAFPINKVQVGLAPPPNLKRVTAKVVSWRNQTHRVAGSCVQIHNGKLDCTRIQSKIKVTRMIPLQRDGDKCWKENQSTLLPGGRNDGKVLLYIPNKTK
jgi:hypothetical protein